MSVRNGHSAVVGLGCFLTPLALCGGLYLAMGQGEQEPIEASPVAQDVTLDDMNFPPIPERHALTGDEAKGFDAEVQRLAALAPVASPFVDPKRYQSDDPTDAAEPAEPSAVTIPEFKLTSVVSSPVGALCSIDQKILRVGGELPGGWSVKSIDVDGRSVTLIGPRDTETTLSLR